MSETQMTMEEAQALTPEQAKKKKIIRVTSEGAALLPLEDFQNFQGGLKELTVKNYGRLKQAIIRRGFNFPVQVWKRPDDLRKIIDGHQRVFAVRKMIEEGWSLPGGRLPADWVLAATEEEARESVLLAISQFGGISPEGLYEFIETGGLDWGTLKDELDLPDFDMEKFDENFYKDLPPGGDQESKDEEEPEKLVARYVVPPFSVLDARKGYWRDRKLAWLSLGIKSEIGRGENLLAFSDTVLEPDEEKRNAHLNEKTQKALGFYETYGTDALKRQEGGYTGTSIFDPVLCEIAYRWFVPNLGAERAFVLDPFAGGSVRGILAAKLGLQYVGIDLSAKQLDANREQAEEILRPEEKEQTPEWIHGDSIEMEKLDPGDGFDFVFSCPPYGNLEVYSEEPGDISNMTTKEFLQAYRKIIGLACARLNDNRFACFVVGDYRDKKTGFYVDFISETIRAFRNSGLALYNHMILVTPVGTLPVRVVRHFEGGRKVGKTHQDVLVFFKGDPSKIPDLFPPIAVESIEELLQLAEEPEPEQGDPLIAGVLAGEEPELPEI